jgi:putative addiction module antidote
MKLELKRIGNSTGLILPKEVLARLGLSQGDSVFLTEMPDGLKVTRTDGTFEKGLEIARRAMKKYRNALTELAK